MSLEAPLKGRWILTHVLQPETLDGARLLQHLLSRQPLANYDELVILPSPHPQLEKSLKAQGFKVSTQDWTSEIKSSPEMARPFYFLTSPKGQSFFAGNYVSPDKDYELIQGYFKNQSVTWLPMWGCHQALRVQNLFDPLALLHRQVAPDSQAQ